MFIYSHSIGGITFQTRSDARIACIQNGHFQKFLIPDSKPDVHQRIFAINRDDLTLPSLTDKEKDNISKFSLYPYIDGSTLTLPPLIWEKKVEINHSIEYSNNYFNIPLLRSSIVREKLESCLSHAKQVTVILHIFSVMIFDYVNLTVDIFYPSDRKKIFEGVWMENGIRRMFTSFLLHFSAVTIHSSCLFRNTSACVFLSPDEGGKSTVLELLSNANKLSDDQNIIRKEGNKFFAYGTPWGSVSNNHPKAKVGGLFLLEKSLNFELIPIKPQDALQFLWNEHKKFWDIQPKAQRIQAFKILYDACFQIPVFKMKFPKDYVDWDAIDKAMSI